MQVTEWAKPFDLVSAEHFVNGMPDIATGIDGYKINQMVPSDSSIVAALAACANFEFRTKRPLITSLIHP